MRLDKWLTVNLVCRLKTIFAPSLRTSYAVLMYHSISDLASDKSHPYYETRTSPKRFAEHMFFLKKEGYQVISLEALSRPQTRSKREKPLVIITFDDGFRDFYDTAVPIMDDYGFTATNFLPTIFISDGSKKRKKFKGIECMTWNEIRGLKDRYSFGSHSVTHTKLIDLDDEKLWRELYESKKTIENKIEAEVNYFCYPYAFPRNKNFLEKLINYCEKLEYKAILTTIIGTHNGINNIIPRLPINNHDDIKLLKAKIEGCYNWMGWIQAIKKGLKIKKNLISVSINLK